MEEVKVWREKVVIPTYEIGEAEKNPIFLEKRVYQGSSGKVYPYPTVERISDVPVDREYDAVFLENEYLRIMILPELGGRIQRAYDKTNGYDFVYYNHVIKPALVGLAGPWISGGIEFNWPQHHRPTTFLPVDCLTERNGDGSCSVRVNDYDRLYGTKGIAKFTLYPGKAYLEVSGQLYNGTSFPQTFLWWANPAVAVNENTQSIFPPDVHAVMDHGKRDVSRFPIATGVYYEMDYSEGVDISFYRNLKVPTSFMAEKSDYDFIGGYDYGREAGLLHVADHHISPGKKQWTWGCGDFGKAWDRNLTDEDGPYVELMTGVFTDNQPDFTWLKPFEEKSFRQYFMPYKGVGAVKNATVDAAVNLEFEEEKARIAVYATSPVEKAEILLTRGGEVLFRECVALSPESAFRTEAFVGAVGDRSEFRLTVTDGGRELVSYRPEPDVIPEIPEPARAIGAPADIATNEELYLAGLHIEQYRHASFLPDPYYLEGLKRDPGDIRLNDAYGMLMLRRGCFAEAEEYFRRARARLTLHNPNPISGEVSYHLALALLWQGKEEEAYDVFYKATWSAEQQETGFFYLAAIDARRGQLSRALEHIGHALTRNTRNVRARGMKCCLLRKLGRSEEAIRSAEENLTVDPFDYLSGYELYLLTGEESRLEALLSLTRGSTENHLNTALAYAAFGGYEEAEAVLALCGSGSPMLSYYTAWLRAQRGLDGSEALAAAEAASSDYCFPNRLEEIAILEYAVSAGGKMAGYYLGNLFYDKLQYRKAAALWEKAAKDCPDFPTVHRNLALALYNKLGRKEEALAEAELAFSLAPDDARLFLELDQLKKKLGRSFEDRLQSYERHLPLIGQRDDLCVEYITLLNLTGQHKRALTLMTERRFHPWEGGEGRVTSQYVRALIALAGEAESAGDPDQSERYLRQALTFPENLGEGKLEGNKDNELYYTLGRLLRKQGRNEEAERCFRLAVRGDAEPQSAMYYNTQPPECILFRGLAHRSLGETAEANRCFYRLLDFGERHLNDVVSIDYFAVSLPDFLIFEEDYTAKNHAHCHYLMALAYCGLGEREKALHFLSEAERTDPSHAMCRVLRGWIDEE